MLEVVTCMAAGALIGVPLGVMIATVRLSCHKLIQASTWRAEYKRSFWGGDEEWSLERDVPEELP